jgi:RNA polymerase-binding transcription factor DksA
MDVLSIEEQEDGSAIVTMSMTELENNMLVEYAIVDILRKQIERMESENKKECFNCEEEINNETIKEFPDTEICSECMNNE